MATADDQFRIHQRQDLERILADSAPWVAAQSAAQPAALGTAVWNSGALAIKAGASALVKTVNTIYGHVGAAAFSKAAADMAALAGTVTNAKVNVFVFMVDASGTLSSAMGTEGATLGAVVWPTVPANKAAIGFVIINPTGTGNFVGGTTALDDGTVIPGAVYVNTTGTWFQPQ